MRVRRDARSQGQKALKDRNDAGVSSFDRRTGLGVLSGERVVPPTWRWTGAHGSTSVWQLDAIEVAAGGLASVGVEGGAYGRVHDLGDCHNGFRVRLVLNSCEVPGRYFR